MAAFDSPGDKKRKFGAFTGKDSEVFRRKGIALEHEKLVFLIGREFYFCGEELFFGHYSWVLIVVVCFQPSLTEIPLFLSLSGQSREAAPSWTKYVRR